MKPDQTLDWSITLDGVNLIAEYESCRLKAYRCPAGVLTIGWGHTGDDVKPDTVWTQAQADKQLLQDISAFSTGVKSLCENAPTDQELAAMTSLAYNIGLGNFSKSTVLKAHNRGDAQSASRAFGLWNKAKGNVLAGLTARRAAEAALYLKSDDPHPMPQTVDPESTTASSPIVAGSAVSVAGGGLTLASQYADQVKQVSESFSVKPITIVAALLLVAGIYVIYQRLKQRNEGWA